MVAAHDWDWRGGGGVRGGSHLVTAVQRPLGVDEGGGFRVMEAWRMYNGSGITYIYSLNNYMRCLQLNPEQIYSVNVALICSLAPSCPQLHTWRRGTHGTILGEAEPPKLYDKGG